MVVTLRFSHSRDASRGRQSCPRSEADRDLQLLSGDKRLVVVMSFRPRLRPWISARSWIKLDVSCKPQGKKGGKRKEGTEKKEKGKKGKRAGERGEGGGGEKERKNANKT